MATYKRDSVFGDHSSGPLIARGLNPWRGYAALSKSFLPLYGCRLPFKHGLAPGKDLAVSPPLCYPYGGAGPSSLGLGPPPPFGGGRHCSHLYPCGRRLLAATTLRSIYRNLRYIKCGCPDFPPSPSFTNNGTETENYNFQIKSFIH